MRSEKGSLGWLWANYSRTRCDLATRSVRGLKAGCDDYVTKPIALLELLARIEAVKRRTSIGIEARLLRVADLELDRLDHTAWRDGRVLDLKPQEFRLLEYLMSHEGLVVTRTMLFEGVWDYHFDPQTGVIDVLISRLRSKIDTAGARPLIHTVRGIGYCLREDEQPQS